MEYLIRGKRHVLLIRVHNLYQPAPEEDWLRCNTQLLDENRFDAASVLSFTPIEGATLPRRPGGDPPVASPAVSAPDGYPLRVPVRR